MTLPGKIFLLLSAHRRPSNLAVLELLETYRVVAPVRKDVSGEGAPILSALGLIFSLFTYRVCCSSWNWKFGPYFLFKASSRGTLTGRTPRSFDVMRVILVFWLLQGSGFNLQLIFRVQFFDSHFFAGSYDSFKTEWNLTTRYIKELFCTTLSSMKMVSCFSTSEEFPIKTGVLKRAFEIWQLANVFQEGVSLFSALVFAISYTYYASQRFITPKDCANW